MPLRNTDQQRVLGKVRLHWARYVARGGFSSPKAALGKLESGGVEQWALFLRTGREYLKSYPKGSHDLAAFLPLGMIKLLTGE